MWVKTQEQVVEGMVRVRVTTPKSDQNRSLTDADMADRQELIRNAVSFLSDPKVLTNYFVSTTQLTPSSSPDPGFPIYTTCPISRS